MSDILIRDVPDDVLGAIDAHAARMGLSRTEYLRRRLAQEVGIGAMTVSARHLQDFARDFADLADPDLMSGAWE
jgi:hypothetical protein